MARVHKTEVLVVGAGPVGLLAAVRLAQRGVSVRVLDEEWRTAAHSYACALHPQSLRLLEEVGLYGDLRELGRRIDAVGFYDAERKRAGIRYSQLDGDYPYLTIVRQDVLEGLLERQLERLGVAVSWNHRVAVIEPAGDKVIVTVDKLGKSSTGYAVAHTERSIEKTMKFEADFVIGADGSRSVVRRTQDIEYNQIGEPRFFAVFEFQTDAMLGDELRVVMTDDSTNVLWPLPDGFCRWNFQLHDADISSESRIKSRLAVQIGRQQFPSLTEEMLRALLNERATWFEGSIGQMRWSMAIRFETRLAQKIGSGRCWLVGDAAHMTLPVGVQSMNVGMREADDITRRMMRILHGNAPFEMLAEFEHQTTAEWRRLVGLSPWLKPRGDTDEWIRSRTDRFVGCIPESGDALVALAGQIGLQASAD